MRKAPGFASPPGPFVCPAKSRGSGVARVADRLAQRVGIDRACGVMSFAGVRGAITLAGVMTLPLAMGDGSPFPARDLAIFLAMGVIIVSLVIASIGLPLLLKGLKLPAETSHQAEEDAARVAAAHAAIEAVERAEHAMAEGHADADFYVAAAARVMDMYRDRIERFDIDTPDQPSAREIERIERELRLAGLKAERTELFRMVRRRELGSEIARKLVRELDLLELRYAA